MLCGNSLSFLPQSHRKASACTPGSEGRTGVFPDTVGDLKKQTWNVLHANTVRSSGAQWNMHSSAGAPSKLPEENSGSPWRCPRRLLLRNLGWSSRCQCTDLLLQLQQKDDSLGICSVVFLSAVNLNSRIPKVMPTLWASARENHLNFTFFGSYQDHSWGKWYMGKAVQWMLFHIQGEPQTLNSLQTHFPLSLGLYRREAITQTGWRCPLF